MNPSGPKSLSRFSAADVRPNRTSFLLARVPSKDGLSPLPLRSSQLRNGTLKAFRDRWGCAAGKWEHDGASVGPRIRVGFSSVWTGR